MGFDMWDQFVMVVGFVGTVGLLLFFSYLKYKRFMAVRAQKKLPVVSDKS